MSSDDFHHPLRLPKNADGAFYTTGYLAPASKEPDAPSVWCGDCLACGAPEAAAPDLLAPLNGGNWDTYFVRQPSTPAEIERACSAVESCCVEALRYGGRDRATIERLGNHPSRCDYVIDAAGELVRSIQDDGEYAPFARELLANEERKRRRRQKKWWQFWR